MAEAEVRRAVPLLRENNYSTWSKRMRHYLVDHGLEKWLTVDPEEEGGTEKQQEKAAAESEKALAKIAAHVSDDLLDTVDACNTAKQAWTALQSMYSPKTLANQLSLHRQIVSLRLGDGESITLYVQRAKQLQRDLKDAGSEMKEP